MRYLNAPKKMKLAFLRGRPQALLAEMESHPLLSQADGQKIPGAGCTYSLPIS